MGILFGGLVYNIEETNGKVTLEDLPSLLAKLKTLSQTFKEEEIKAILTESASNMTQVVDFQEFLKIHLSFQARAAAEKGGPKNSSAFLKAVTSTLVHTVSQSDKGCYVHHMNIYLVDDS